MFNVYELAFVIKKSSDQSFKKKCCNDLMGKLSGISRLFNTMKRVRANFQKPCKSKEEALKRRGDKKQHVVDAAFKFLDKFGYLSIMKDLLDIYYKDRDGVH